MKKLPIQIPATTKGWIALALGILALLGVTVAITQDGRTTTITVTVRGPAGPTTVTTTKAAADQAAADNTHANMKDEDPTGITGAQVAAAKAQQRAIATRGPPMPILFPLASPQQAGCRTRTVVNRSSRNGVRPQVLVMHYTVSPNRPGFQDVNAIVQLFNQRSFAASSNYVIDRDGNCAYIVPEAEKAWTQAAANPVSISWEIINTGSERPLFTPHGYKLMGRIVSDAAKRWNIPLRRGAVNHNCTVARKGIVQHADWGVCGGGHDDILPFSLTPIINAAIAYRHSTERHINYPRIKHFGPKRRAACHKLAVLRKNAASDRRRGKQGWPQARRAAAGHEKALVGRGQAACHFTR